MTNPSPAKETPKRHKFTIEDCRNGGYATLRKIVTKDCPYCGARFENVSQLVFNGHLGLERFAQRYTAGDLTAARRKLGLLGIAATDPFPSNGAFANAHEFAAEVRAKRDST